MRSRRFLLALAVLAWAGLFFAASHLALEALARRVEARLDACLWGDFDEHRQLLVASNHVDRGAGRVMICGPSEAREGFLPEVVEAGLPGWRVYQGSLSMGVLSDVGLMLEYLERAYGPAALPEVLVVVLTPRFSARIGAEVSPLAAALGTYSPFFAVEHEGRDPRLVPRGTLDGLVARLRFQTRQGLRYRNALRAVRVAGPGALLEAPGSRARLGPPFAHARYQWRPRWDDARVADRLAWPNNHFLATSALDFEAIGAGISADLADLRARAERGGTRLLFVVMSERSEVRALFPDGAYERYLEAVRVGLDEVPLLALRDFLEDEEFFDANHPAANGARRLSERLAAELRQRLE